LLSRCIETALDSTAARAPRRGRSYHYRRAVLLSLHVCAI